MYHRREMIRRPACVIALVLVTALAACENKSVVSSSGSTLPPSRAAATGEFPDNPLLAFVPADTPYAFASFKPAPIDVIRKMFAMAKPMWRRALTTYMAVAPDASLEGRVVQDVLYMLDTLDIKTFEEYGFSAKARLVAYGIGAYPVFRVELSNGDRVFDLIRRTAERWGQKITAPSERAGRRYWIVDAHTWGLFAAVGPKELVVAAAPRAVIDANLPALLGEQRPASGMTKEQFRALAERDGFTGQGLGFVDLARVGAMITGAASASPDCAAAVAAIAKRAPRLAVGYDDFTLHRMSFGMVLELAPDVLADARGLSGSLAGLDRLLAQKPAMMMAVAGNLENGRGLLGRVAGALRELGQRCQSSDLADGAADMAAAASSPLPPFLAGVRGGYVVLDNLKMGPRGPESIEGFGTLQLDRAGELLKFAASQLPNFDVPLDGKAHALPSAIPFPGHVAANQSAIGVALGPTSATTAVRVLEGKPAPAPLALMSFDYSRLADLILAGQHGPDADSMRDIFKAFGVLTMQLLVDARGAVTWMSIDLR
jgi:hypothetical protein